MTLPYVACLLAAASFYHLPPRVLPSIQAVEGGRVGLVHPNSNGTADLGLMQVNTVWIQPLATYAGLPPGAVAVRLIDDPCFNIAAAAAIMHVHLVTTHGNLMQAIGLYHSHTAALGEAYKERVLTEATRLFAQHH